MIKTWKHKGLKALFLTGSKKGILPEIAKKLQRRLDVHAAADSLQAFGLPGFRLHPLSGGKKGHYSIRVTGNWRLTFRMEKSNVFDVDLEDYHGK